MTKPYKFTRKKKAAYLKSLREGNRRGQAAHAVGVSRWTVAAAIRNDPAFRAQVEEAELDATEQVENALWKKAIDGNVTACQVWLYNRAPDRWKDKRNLNLKVRADDFSNDELLAIILESPPRQLPTLDLVEKLADRIEEEKQPARVFRQSARKEAEKRLKPSSAPKGGEGRHHSHS